MMDIFSQSNFFFAVKIFFRSQDLFSQSRFIFAVKIYFRSQDLFSQSNLILTTQTFDCEKMTTVPQQNFAVKNRPFFAVNRLNNRKYFVIINAIYQASSNDPDTNYATYTATLNLCHCYNVINTKGEIIYDKLK